MYRRPTTMPDWKPPEQETPDASGIGLIITGVLVLSGLALTAITIFLILAFTIGISGVLATVLSVIAILGLGAYTYNPRAYTDWESDESRKEWEKDHPTKP
jgi:hypothetical protein